MTKEDLIRKYPTWFASVTKDMVGGFGIGDGWMPMFTELCERIAETNPPVGFYFTQIKEKFGLLRIYCRNGTDVIENLLAQYEKKSGSIGEMCGSTSEVETKGKGRIATWCRQCRNGPGPDALRF